MIDVVRPRISVASSGVVRIDGAEAPAIDRTLYDRLCFLLRSDGHTVESRTSINFVVDGPAHPVVFILNERECLRLEHDGAALVDGRPAVDDREIYEAFARWVWKSARSRFYNVTDHKRSEAS